MKEPVSASCLAALFTELIGAIPPVTHSEGRVNKLFGIRDPFFSPPSLRNTHLHSLLDEPVIVTGPKVTVKHLSDVVDVQSLHFFFCARGNPVRGPGCDTPHSVD